jgi:hypothetical protein
MNALSAVRPLLPIAETDSTVMVVALLLIGLAVIGLVIYISYRSTLDDDSRGTEP